MAYVYEHWRFDKGERPVCFYVGIGSDDDGKYKRAFTKWGRNDYWSNISNMTNYSASIKVDNISWEDACSIEKELIQFYGRSDLGSGSLCNRTDGGDGYINPSPEVRAKMSQINSGNRNPMFGKKLSDEHKGKISMAGLGRVVSDITKEKQRGNKNALGAKHTQETKEKMSMVRKGVASHKRKIILDFNTGVFYYSVVDAASVLKINKNTLTAWLSGWNRNPTSLKYV